MAVDSPKAVFKKPILIHIICWIFFISYELGLVYYSIGKLENLYVYFVYYPIHIGFFYAYIILLDRSFSRPKPKYWVLAFAYLGLLSTYLLIKFVVGYVISDFQSSISNPYIFIQGFLLRNMGRGLYFTVLATFYWSGSYISYFRKKATEAEKQQLIIQKEKAELETLLTKSRNAYLQQQINPHMLFNALNFVYSSAQKYSDDAANCIWLLSEIMRFSLEEAGSDGKIILEREAEQIENLLAINRYRYNEQLYINVDIKGDFSRLRIIPLILLTLTENVFKHGNLIEEPYPATIQLHVDDNGKLNFFSRNLKKSKSEYCRSQQLGLKNVRIRLDSTYPENYWLEIAEPGEFYELTLTLNL